MKSKPELVVMSSKGQVVVPRAIRESIKADAGTEFVVYGERDSLVFKKIRVPSFSSQDFNNLVSQNEKRLKAAGYVNEEAINDLIIQAIQGVRKQR